MTLPTLMPLALRCAIEYNIELDATYSLHPYTQTPMNIRTLFIAAITLMLMLSCNTKQKPIDQLTDLAEDLKADSKDYTEQDWQEVDKRLEQINLELDKYQDQNTEAGHERCCKRS